MIGEVIGSHRVTARVGEGSTGTVYRAVHTVIGQHVAIKFLQRELGEDRALMSRYFEALRAVTAVPHPSIVELLDFGYHQGAAFIVMEFLEYESLKARLAREGALRGLEVLEIARQVGGALDVAHQAGVVHRDLKPDSIVLVPDPAVSGGERVKLLDFGIAELLSDPATGERLRRSDPAQAAYLAPEQLGAPGMAPGAGLGPGVDLYALGCILYELVSGRPPFAASSWTELVAMHLHRAPPALADDVVPGLEPIVRTLLAKRSEERFYSAGTFLDALDALGRDELSGAHRAAFPDEPVSISFASAGMGPAVQAGSGSEPGWPLWELAVGVLGVILAGVLAFLALR